MAEKNLRPKAAGAQVARAAGTARTLAEVAPGRKVDRYLLPSRTVLAVMVPNVGEFMELRERASIVASKESAQPTQHELSHHLGVLAIRKLVKGISLAPVPVIHKEGFSKEEAQQRAAREASVAVDEYVAALTEKHARRANGTEPAEDRGVTLDAVPTPDEVPVLVAQYAARLLDDACYEAEDDDAMRAAANVVPVTDFMWDDPTAYINTMRSAELGSVEAADYMALHEILGAVFVRIAQAAGGGRSEGPFGGATKPKIRPWR